MHSKTTLIVAGLLILTAVLYLLVSSTGDAAQYFLTIAEARRLDAAARQRAITVSGAVLGGSVAYDANVLTFSIVQIPGDPRDIERAGGIEQAIHAAVNNPAAPTLAVVYHGSPPEMLQPEAQAIVSGRLADDGRFYADEIRLKCPSRYEEALPTPGD